VRQHEVRIALATWRADPHSDRTVPSLSLISQPACSGQTGERRMLGLVFALIAAIVVGALAQGWKSQSGVL
jgi:hypothetical protein